MFFKRSNIFLPKERYILLALLLTSYSFQTYTYAQPTDVDLATYSEYQSGFYLSDVSSFFGQSLYGELGRQIYEKGPILDKNVLLRETKSKRSNIFELFFDNEMVAQFSITSRKLGSNSDVDNFTLFLHNRLLANLDSK